MILYHSTYRHRAPQRAKMVTLPEALRLGQAPDGGLYMPDSLPFFSGQMLAKWHQADYLTIAEGVLAPFFEGFLELSLLRTLLQKAYSQTPGWEEGVELPLENYAPQRYLARLDRGPTASFKDFAARLLAQVLPYCYPSGYSLTILVATSGDTGSAVGEAFRGIAGVRVLILYPEAEVSPIQQKQLDHIGQNVRALRISGKFDDCQQLVKTAFLDPDLQHLSLTSANSISIGRVLPQIVYYFYMYAQVVQVPGEEVIFAVPSGNLGNSLGAELARRMGLPVRKIIIGTNLNQAFPIFLATGAYHKIQPSLPCLSNAMNVGHPSNAARYLDLYGGILDKEGVLYQMPDLPQMQQYLAGYAFEDAATEATMRRFYQEHQLILEPHGAVGCLALEKHLAKYSEDLPFPAIVLETAHPAKFAQIVERVLGFAPPACPVLEKVNQRPAQVQALAANYPAFKDFLMTQDA
ncbi:MAG: threonine synthase [Microscillaceae bacterium]|nr:threonine synthase [Microscillaceae bacterium]